MASTPLSPVSAVEARFTDVQRVDLRLPDLALAESRPHAPEAALHEVSLAESRETLAPARLLVRIDVESGRFVNTLLDPRSDEVIRKYPSDAQLAFSRAVRAYINALSGTVTAK